MGNLMKRLQNKFPIKQGRYLPETRCASELLSIMSCWRSTSVDNAECIGLERAFESCMQGKYVKNKPIMKNKVIGRGEKIPRL